MTDNFTRKRRFHSKMTDSLAVGQVTKVAEASPLPIVVLVSGSSVDLTPIKNNPKVKSYSVFQIQPCFAPFHGPQIRPFRAVARTARRRIRRPPSV
jgi:hypothetical protein